MIFTLTFKCTPGTLARVGLTTVERSFIKSKPKPREARDLLKAVTEMPSWPLSRLAPCPGDRSSLTSQPADLSGSNPPCSIPDSCGHNLTRPEPHASMTTSAYPAQSPTAPPKPIPPQHALSSHLHWFSPHLPRVPKPCGLIFHTPHLQQDLQFPTPDCPLCFMPSSPSKTPSSQLLSAHEDSAQVSSSRKSS